MEFFIDSQYPQDETLPRAAVLLVGSGLTHLGENVSQLLTLPLGADVCAQATLQELEGALILGHLQQLHAPLLVGGMADHLTDDVAHELGVFGLHLERKRIHALEKVLKGYCCLSALEIDQRPNFNHFIASLETTKTVHQKNIGGVPVR